MVDLYGKDGTQDTWLQLKCYKAILSGLILFTTDIYHFHNKNFHLENKKPKVSASSKPEAEANRYCCCCC